LKFGIAAYGMSGMDVDYRNTNVDCGSGKGCYTNFQFMEVSPALAYKVNDIINLGFLYKSPVSMHYSRVMDFNGDGKLHGMDLEQPQQVGNWDDQLMFKIGEEYKVNDILTLKATTTEKHPSMEKPSI
jgi:long-subunit fatty acid transport protein